MPIYRYRCRACGNGFEERKRIDERYDVKCNACGRDGENAIEIVVGTPVVIWKGGPPTQPNMGRTAGRGAPNKPSDDEIDDGILGPDGPYF